MTEILAVAALFTGITLAGLLLMIVLVASLDALFVKDSGRATFRHALLVDVVLALTFFKVDLDKR